MNLRKNSTTEVKTHDYTLRIFGHDYVIHRIIDGGKMLEMSGWGRNIKMNDFILLSNGESSTRYKVNRIEYERDPQDMWNMTASFAPRE